MGRVFQTLGELGNYVQEQGSSTSPFVVADPGIPLSAFMGDETTIPPVWGTQPSVRKVTDFIARQVAGIPLHGYQRVSDTDRLRVTTGALGSFLGKPTSAKGRTAYRFWYYLLLDGLIYDRWAAVKIRETTLVPYRLVRIPARRFRFVRDGLDQIVAVRIFSDDGTYTDQDPDRFVFDVGYAERGANGTSPISTLRQLLDENTEAISYRRAIWKRGLRAPAWIERPKAWPADGKARQRFLNQWSAYESGGALAGGTPVLDDGMKLQSLDSFKPQSSDELEGRRLSDAEVASAYHIAPELVGAREGTYSNIDAYRQMLYGISLGPYITAWESAVNYGLSDDFLDDGHYVEAYVEAAMRGSFLEQARAASTATGRPWMTTNEQRARFNLPAVDGGDTIITPLNVTVGGQASPTDSGTQNLQSADDRALRKAAQTATAAEAAQSAQGLDPETVVEHPAVAAVLDAQARAAASRLGAKDALWWDGDRWDDELGAALATALAASGIPSQDEPARAAAAAVNAATRNQIQAAVDRDPGKASAAVRVARLSAHGHLSDLVQDVADAVATDLTDIADLDLADLAGRGDNPQP